MNGTLAIIDCYPSAFRSPFTIELKAISPRCVPFWTAVETLLSLEGD